MLKCEMNEATNDSCPEKYPFKELFNYLARGVFPDNADKQYKHGLRKISQYFVTDVESYFMWMEA